MFQKQKTLNQIGCQILRKLRWGIVAKLEQEGDDNDGDCT